jgi:hypothetical protein
MNGASAAVDYARPELLMGLPRPVVRWTVAAGVATGVAYTLSPLTVIVSMAFVPLWRRALRDLVGAERRAVAMLLGAAIGLRVIAIVVLCITADRNAGSFGVFFGDEQFYLERAFRLYSLRMGIPISAESFLYAYDKMGISSYQDLLVFLQMLVGPVPYGIHLLNTLLFVCCIVWLYRIARSSFGPAASLVGLIYLLFLPSLFMWSVSALKESLFLLLTSSALICSVWALSAPRAVLRMAALAATLMLGWWLEGFRTGSRLIVLGGTALAYGGRAIAFSRAALVTAFIAFAAAGVVAWQRGLPAALQTQIEAAARYHRGHVFTPGHVYKLLDQSFYSAAWTPLGAPRMNPAETARYVVRAVVHFVVEPIPWRMSSAFELAYVPELMIWYAGLVLVPIGAVHGFRRDPTLTCLLVSYGLLSAAIIALNSGNIGTLVRHRALIAPFLGWIAALGFVSLAGARWRERSARS